MSESVAHYSDYLLQDQKYLYLFAFLWAVFLCFGRFKSGRWSLSNWFFFSAIFATVIIWNTVVFYPVYMIRYTLSKQDIIEIIEEKTAVRFNPYAPYLSFPVGASLKSSIENSGLNACGGLCQKNYSNGLSQIFGLSIINSGSEDSGSYLQYFKGKPSDIKIITIKNNEKKKNILKNVQKNYKHNKINYKYNRIYELLGAKIIIYIFSINGSLTDVSVYMDKRKSMLAGFQDDLSGMKDRENILHFSWLDAWREQQKEKAINK